MEYKILETGNSSKHNNQKQLPVEYKILETGNSRKHNNQNNYQWNIKQLKQGTVENITIKTTTSGI
jgi:hypothetical protein